MNNGLKDDEAVLTLASEECPPDIFSQIHTFGPFEDRIIRKLMAHGPVLIKGGRGSGKSALLIEANNRLNRSHRETAFGVYVSLRYLPLLRTEGEQYEQNFCYWLSNAISNELAAQELGTPFEPANSITNLQINLDKLAQNLQKRIVLLFDDAAHIGREKPLTEFFDIFRSLSTDNVSCKASIYPGVTKFGIRFDVYNDSTVIELVRDERSSNFSDFFAEVITRRFPEFSTQVSFSESITIKSFSNLIGRSVLGNMRAFVFACNWFMDRQKSIGFPELTEGLLNLASNYYWPLLEEVAPKLGVYEPFIAPATELSEKIFEFCGNKNTPNIIVHRDIISKFTKLFEILEYVGFLTRREASRSMKSGGRGAVFAINLCTLLEKISGARVTSDTLNIWTNDVPEPAEIHTKSTAFHHIQLPSVSDNTTLSILNKPVNILSKSRAYPYGLTQAKIELLTNSGYSTVGTLADATDEDLHCLESIGEKTISRIRNVLFQAIWM